jgi:hypothetical protein
VSDHDHSSDLPSEYRLEQLALDEAPPAVQARLDEPDVRARVDALRAEDAELLAANPSPRALTIVRARVAAAKDRPTRSIHWLVAVPVLVGLAAALVVILRSPPEIGELGDSDERIAVRDVRVVPDDRLPSVVPDMRPPDVRPPDVRPVDIGPDPTTGPDEIRIKGQQAHLVIHRREVAGAVRLGPDSVTHEGDLLQVGYAAAGQRYGVIVSIDGGGAVTLHWPDAADESTSLEQGEVVALEHAYELDAAPAFERFVFVTADKPIDAAMVVDAAERVADSPKRARTKRLVLPKSWQQSSILLRKADP